MIKTQSYLQMHWPLLLGFLVVVLFGLNFLGFDFTYMPGDLGDGRFNNYLLEHAFRYFTGTQKTLWEAPFMYPESQVLTYSDNLLGTAPFYALFRLLDFSRETSFQFWYLGLSVANYLCAFLFLKRLFDSKHSAVLGAILFAVSIGLVSQIGHAQTFPRFPMPLTFLALLLFSESLRPKYFLLACLGLVYQFYCAIYLGFFLFVPFFIFSAYLFFHKRNRLFQLVRSWKWWTQMTLSGAVAVILLALLMLPYYERAQTLDPKTYESIFLSLPTVKSYFFSVHGSLLWNWIDDLAVSYQAFWDHQIFPGGLAILGGLALFVLLIRPKIRNEKPLLFGISITGLVCCLLFVRMDAYSLYEILFRLPGFSAMRSLTRIVNLNVLFFAIGLSFCAFRLFKWYPSKSSLIFVLVLTVLIIDNFVPGKHTLRISKAQASARVTELVGELEKIPSDGIVSYEPVGFEGHPNDLQLDAMLACQELGLKCINGYSAIAPYGFDTYWDQPNQTTREKWLTIQNKNIEDLYVIR